MRKRMTLGYNVQADETNRIERGNTIIVKNDDDDGDDDESIPIFLRNCIRCFKARVQPSNTDIRITHVLKNQQQVDEEQTTVSNPSVIVVSKSILCTLENRLFTGNYYTFLMTHPLPDKKTSAHVGYSADPAYDVYLHNNLLTNDRTTSAAAPHWILDMVLGPLISVEDAIECCKDLVSNTRGMKSKRERAVLLSHVRNVPLYDVAKKPTTPLDEYLAKNAPPIYTERYRKMIGSPRHASSSKKAKRRIAKKKSIA